jgi:ABC-type xylose transport system permease subunit
MACSSAPSIFETLAADRGDRVLAVGMLMVIVSGNIDLSIGAW